MARPKTGKPSKRSLNLTVSDNTRVQLALISKYKQKSISALVEEWAEGEAKSLFGESEEINQKVLEE